MTHSLNGPVFISYSRRDEVVMRRIANSIRDQGIQVWVDNEKLVPGTPIWEEEIEKAIKAAAAVMVVTSPDSKNSEWVRREISLSDHYHKRVYPVLVRGDEDSSITLRLITRQFVDLRENEDIGLNSLSMALVPYLEKLIAEEAKAREEQRAQEEKERLAQQKAEEDRLGQEKAKGELKAKQDAEQVEAQKADEERITREKAEAERKAKENAQRLTAQKAEDEHIAQEKAEAEPKEKEESQHLAAQKAKEKRLAAEKADAERKTREKSKLLDAKTEEERLGRKKAKTQREIAGVEGKPAKSLRVQTGIIGIVAIALVLCVFASLNYLPGIFGGPPATEAPATEPPITELPATTEGPATEAACEGDYVLVPKNLGNPYYDAANTGAQEAAEELGINVLYEGSATADATDALVPTGEAALEAGISVVTWDSAIAPEGRNLLINQAVTQGIGAIQIKMASDLAGADGGQIAVLSATSTAPNQNAWIEVMKEELKKPEYSKLERVEVVYGDDDDTKSYNEAQALFTKYPDLKIIIAPTTVGIAASARAVTDADLIGKVFVTGLGTPNQMREYVKSGAAPQFALWNPADVGYLSVYAMQALATGEIKGVAGDKFTAGRLGEYTVEADPDLGLNVLLGEPFVWDKDNIDDSNW